MIRLLLTFLGTVVAMGVVAAEDKSIDLLEVVKAGILPRGKPVPFLDLDPQWVGTVRWAFVGKPDGEGKRPFFGPDNLRVNALWKDPDGRIVIARANRNRDTYLESEMAVYLRKLPSFGELAQMRTLDQLRAWFGPQHGFTDGWGDFAGGGTVHWSEGWTYFTMTKDSKVRWLGVFALVSCNKPGYPDKETHIDGLRVGEGVLEPADPDSAKQKSLFKTAEELDAEQERKEEEERSLLPQPLRDFVAARQAPGDSDLIAYGKAVDAFRHNPDPALLNEIAARIDEDAVVMQSYMEDLLLRHPVAIKVEDWRPENYRKAVRYAVDALRSTTTPSGINNMLPIVMGSLGPGHIGLKDANGLTVLSLDLVPNDSVLGYEQRWDASFSSDEAHFKADKERVIEALRSAYPMAREN